MNKLLCKHKLYISFMLIGIALLAFLPTSCTCNCSDDDSAHFGDWRPPVTKIAFLSDGKDGLSLIKFDGTELSIVFVADNTVTISGSSLCRSPDGDKIAFRYYEYDIPTSSLASRIAVADVNGSDYVDIIDTQFRQAPSWSPDSKKLAVSSNPDGNNEVYVVNADGTGATNITNNPASDYLPAWSPDGSKIAFIFYRGGAGGIYLMNPDGSGQAKLMDDYFQPAERLLWSPDGSKIACWAIVGENRGLYVINADGTGLAQLLDSFPAGPFSSLSWSIDGSKLLFSDEVEIDGSEQTEIFVINADGTNLTNLTNSSSEDTSPTWSPGGTMIAFSSDRDGNYDIFVMNADGTEQTNITNSPEDEEIIVWGQ